jgi:large subunit ribosomal protein L15
MKLNDLVPAKKSTSSIKRVGRGNASGWGKTCGRGENGQKSRSGGGVRLGFEGGQMPLIRRLPKRGFTNIFAKKYDIVNIGELNRFDKGLEVSKEVLAKAGLIRSSKNLVKILANGELKVGLILQVNSCSQVAKDMIEKAGGKVEIV